MKLSRLLPKSIFASKATDSKVTLFYNKNTSSICYRETDGTVVEVGSGTAALAALQSSVEDVESAAPTYTEVAVSSAEILALGTSAKTLLPAPGANMYYDIEKVILEFSAGGTPYTLAGDYLALTLFNWKMVGTGLITGLADKVSIVPDIDNAANVGAEDIVINLDQTLNQPFGLTTYNETDPLAGNGTLLVKIWYTARTVGTEL